MRQRVLWVSAIFAIAGCSTARRGDPIVEQPGAIPPEAAQRGHAVFDQFCNGCHPGGAAGLGPAINNKPLPDPAIRYQVRHGVGAMPGFDETVINDGDLEDLLAYLEWLGEREPALP